MKPDLAVMAEYCRASKLDLVRRCDWHTHNIGNGYLAMKRTPGAKILAVAHIDFLQSGVVHTVSRRRIVSSALDDRAGVYIVMDLLPKLGVVADILLTDNEESGRSTAKDLGMSMLEQYNWIVQFDRRDEGAVHYGYSEMKPLLEKYFPKVEHGAFTCIAAIESCCAVGAFNVGVGYSQEHSEKCSLSSKVLNRQMMRFLAFYKDMVDTKIEHACAFPGKEVHTYKPMVVHTSTIPGQVRTYPRQLCGARPSAVKHTSHIDEDGEKWLLDKVEDYWPENCTFCGDVVPASSAGYRMTWQDESLCWECRELLLIELEESKKYLHLHISDVAYMNATTVWFWDKEANVYRMYDMEKSDWAERLITPDNEWLID